MSREGLWADEFGEVWSPDGRVRAGPNWARQAPVSGIVLGDERMHDLLRLEEDEFVSLFATAAEYIRAAMRRWSRAACFMIFMNGGPKSAASVAHAHLQVVGRADGRHFAYPEAVLSGQPAGYWDRVREVHAALGLAARGHGCVAWANLAPVKERDVTAVAPTVEAGARFVHALLRILLRRGTNSFSLAAIPSPAVLAGGHARRPLAGRPAVLFRLVDRGDARVAHGDIGCMELFGSAVVATDPFLVARWLREGGFAA